MFNKYLNLIGILLLIPVMCSFSITTFAEGQANTNRFNREKELKTIVQTLRTMDPQKAETRAFLYNLSDNNLISNQDKLQIKFDKKSRKTELTNSLGYKTRVNLPKNLAFKDSETVENKIVHGSVGNKVDIITEAVDGGFRQILNIKDKSAPSIYDFPVDMESGDKLIINSAGDASLINSQGDKKISIAKPWAVDSKKKNLKTWYSVENGNILRQHIDLTNASFPVLADPQWCGDMIWKTEWKNRAESEGGWTLMTYPTWCGRAGGVNSYTDMFNELLSKAEKRYDLWPQSNWNYTSAQGRSMYNQLRCHQAFAWFFKSSYNIEPHRPLVEWRVMISRNLPYACNP